MSALNTAPSSGSTVNLIDYYPALSPLYMQWELSFRTDDITLWLNRNYYLAPTVVALYLFFCYAGTQWMQSRKPMNVSVLLKHWNLLCALFSFIGALRVVPHLLTMIYYHGFDMTIRVSPHLWYANGSCGVWVLFFLISKYFELLDTIFLIVRKKPVNFIHWYHHATVLLYTWDACAVELPAGIYFVAMNMTVHSAMYFYYFKAATASKPPRWGVSVTVAQIGQMLIGLCVTGMSIYCANRYPHVGGRNTAWNDFEVNGVKRQAIAASNSAACCLMYSTYFYLFGRYFMQRYVYKQWKEKPM